jgi:transcriptional regulator with XRE-family HTH domain
MQAISYISESRPYPGDMPIGRPSSKKRTALGSRITTARQAAGLTQQELAGKVGVTQRVVAYWEREAVSLRADQLDALANALHISTDALLGRSQPKARAAAAGPVGKARKIFAAISKLPRHQQEKIFSILEPFVAHHGRGNAA